MDYLLFTMCVMTIIFKRLFCLWKRYDEWVKADRIIWPGDKGGTKRKQKKKIKVSDNLSLKKPNKNKTYLFRTLEKKNIFSCSPSPQNKEDGEEDKTKLGIRRGRPPLKSTPPSTSRSLSKTPSSEGRSSSKNSRPADASALPNGDSKTVHCPCQKLCA